MITYFVPEFTRIRTKRSLEVWKVQMRVSSPGCVCEICDEMCSYVFHEFISCSARQKGLPGICEILGYAIHKIDTLAQFNRQGGRKFCV